MATDNYIRTLFLSYVATNTHTYMRTLRDLLVHLPREQSINTPKQASRRGPHGDPRSLGCALVSVRRRSTCPPILVIQRFPFSLRPYRLVRFPPATGAHAGAGAGALLVTVKHARAALCALARAAAKFLAHRATAIKDRFAVLFDHLLRAALAVHVRTRRAEQLGFA